MDTRHVNVNVHHDYIIDLKLKTHIEKYLITVKKNRLVHYIHNNMFIYLNMIFFLVYSVCVCYAIAVQ